MERTQPVAWILLAALALAAGALSCRGERHEPAPPDLPALSVEVAVAAEQEWRDALELTASIEPLQRAAPGTVLMGRVERVPVREGDRVAAGQVLARIESRDVAARVAQAESAVAAARAQETNARLALERARRLHERQAASRRDLDDATAAHEAALAQLDAAQEGVKAAQVYLGYSEVRAPFAGVVAAKRIEVGDTATPGAPLFVIEDISQVKVEAQLPEAGAARLAVGDTVTVESQALRREGRIIEIVPAADPRSRTITVRARLDNPDRALRSGMFARMRLAGPGRPAVAVPAAAIVRRGPLTGVFVVGDEPGAPRARLRFVTLGAGREGLVEVLTGLRAGERFVATPPAALEDGRRVEVRG